MAFTTFSRRQVSLAIPFLPTICLVASTGAWARDERYPLITPANMCLDGNGRERVGLEILGRRVVTIIAGGQSNCSNTADGGYRPRHPALYNLNIGDGNIYRAEEPLLGCDVAAPGKTSNFLTRLGDEILLAGLADSAILVPWAISGVHATLWAKGGSFHQNAHTTARRVIDAGLAQRSKCICIWQHGESDNVLGTGRNEYTSHIASVADALTDFLGPVPFVTALASFYQGYISPEIRDAQRDLVHTGGNRYVGPDTDALADDEFTHIYRNPENLTHWSAEGAAQVARLWLNAVTPMF